MTTPLSSRDARALQRSASSARENPGAAQLPSAKRAKPSEPEPLDTGGDGSAVDATADIQLASGTGATPCGTAATGDDAALDATDTAAAGADAVAPLVASGDGGDGDDGSELQGPSGMDSMVPPAPPDPTAYVAAPVQVVYRDAPRKEKRLRLAKFRGLDGVLPVSAWLQSVQSEIRRQATTLKTEWRSHELFFELASHFEDEALRWYGTVAQGIAPEDETIEHLSILLRGKYTVQRSDPEVVERLNGRHQMRGERLVDYAQSLREIVADRTIGEEWLVSAFLKGMSDQGSATHVRGHWPQSLDAAVRIAVQQVGEYGEGHAVGLDVAIRRRDDRDVARSRATATATSGGGQEQSSGLSNSDTVVSGYGVLGGTSGILGGPGGRPPRYDTEGRLIPPKSSLGGQWNGTLVPPGFTLATLIPAPAATAPPPGMGSLSRGRAGSNPLRKEAQLDGGSGGQAAKRAGKSFKMESYHEEQTNGGVVQGQMGSGLYGRTQPLLTKEDRLRNHRRYLEQRRQREQRGPRATAPMSRGSSICFYCHEEGHFSRDCERKKADLADENSTMTQAVGGGAQGLAGSGNGSRA